MVNVRIVVWDVNQAWTTWSAYHPRSLERRLLRYTGRSRREVKRLVQQMRNQACVDLALDNAADHFAAESLRSLLESLGAVVRIEDVEHGAVAERPCNE